MTADYEIAVSCSGEIYRVPSVKVKVRRYILRDSNTAPLAELLVLSHRIPPYSIIALTLRLHGLVTVPHTGAALSGASAPKCYITLAKAIATYPGSNSCLLSRMYVISYN